MTNSNKKECVITWDEYKSNPNFSVYDKVQEGYSVSIVDSENNIIAHSSPPSPDPLEPWIWNQWPEEEAPDEEYVLVCYRMYNGSYDIVRSDQIGTDWYKQEVVAWRYLPPLPGWLENIEEIV